jgi:CIC family chloride channel protein
MTAELDLAGIPRSRIGLRWHRLRRRWRARWRALGQRAMREHEASLIVLGALLGVLAGAGVAILRRGVEVFAAFIYDIPWHGDLSEGYALDWWRVMLLPVVGGLVVGCLTAAIRSRRPHEIIDAIEANALYGGRMSLTDTMNVSLTAVLSCGFGASLGLEAGYTQLGAGIGSRVGMMLRLRRDDLRTLVGCGAAAAVAAAFNAPLAGAFYAFELVIGSYELGMLAPVVISSLAATFVARAVFGHVPVFVVDQPVMLTAPDYGLFVLLGFLSAGLAIVVMRGVTATEQWFQARSIPHWARPAAGGLALSVMALTYPQVLGSGHGGIVTGLHTGYALPFLVGLIAAKIAASAISIGAGFRGGLFSTGLFLGSLTGAAAARAIHLVQPDYPIDTLAYTLVGMGAVAAGIIGAPVTMILLVLEGTGDFSATVGVMCGVITTSIVVRYSFGYSFATWRFHLRGLKISSPEDVGWLGDLKIWRLMRRDTKLVSNTMTVAQTRDAYPIGSTKRVIVLDGDRLAGLLDLAVVHGPDLGGPPETLTLGDILTGPPAFLLPDDNIRTALTKFSDAQVESLAVVDGRETMHVVGFITEAYALRRYSQELERRRGRDLGDSDLYASTIGPDS